MRGKFGLVVGLAAGYVLGTRAGRERYEQIKAQAVKVWELDPVQNQVAKVTAFGKSALGAVPNALWDGAKKVTSAATGSGSVQDKAERAKAAAKAGAKDVADAVGDSVDAAQEAGEATAAKSRTSSSRSSSARS